MAYDFLINNGYKADFSNKIKKAITQHRFRNNKPDTLEAKILFDSDKLDVMGCIGICRTLFYEGEMNIPIYIKKNNENDELDFDLGKDSFVYEYNFKLKKLSVGLYTRQGKEIAKSKQKTLANFYKTLLKEIKLPYRNIDKLKKLIKYD